MTNKQLFMALMMCKSYDLMLKDPIEHFSKEADKACLACDIDPNADVKIIIDHQSKGFSVK